MNYAVTVTIVHTDGSREEVGETYFNDLDRNGTYRVMVAAEKAVTDPWACRDQWEHIGEAAYITLP